MSHYEKAHFVKADVAAGLVATSLHDAERKMRDPSALDHPGALQLDRLGAQVVEQSDAVPEQDGHQVYVYLVEEARSDPLLRDAGGAYTDGLVACYRFRLLYGAFDAVRDERERRSFVNPFLWERMGNNKDRYVHGVPATPRIGYVERPPSRHQRPYRLHLLKDLGAGRRDLERHRTARHFIVGISAEVPRKDPLAALAEGPLGAVVRPSDETIH